jgi:hypothetical protein
VVEEKESEVFWLADTNDMHTEMELRPGISSSGGAGMGAGGWDTGRWGSAGSVGRGGEGGVGVVEEGEGGSCLLVPPARLDKHTWGDSTHNAAIATAPH